MKILLSIFIGLLAIIAGILYYQYHFHKPTTFQKPAVVTIGWIGPLSGNARILGVDNLDSVKLALTEYNASKKKEDPSIRIVSADDGYDSNKTQQQYQVMIENEKPQAIFIITYSGVEKLADKALKDNIIVIDDLDNDLNLAGFNHNIFLIAKETEEIAGIFANHIIEHQKKNVAILYNSNDDFMNVLASTLTQILNASDVNTKDYEFNTVTTNFKPLLEQAKNQNADSYVFLGHSETAKAMKQARELGILARFYAGSLIPDPNFRAEAKEALEGSFFVYFGAEEGNEPQAEQFLKSFKQSYRRLPVIEWTAMQAYDAANLLIASIETAYEQEGNFEDNLREALLHVENYPGVSGNLTMQKNGSIKGIKPALYIYKDKKIIKATPKD